MSSVRPVPETGLMSDDELSADDAWPTARHHGLRALLAGAFVRFRYGDGFSHARAFAFQLALATVPLIIAGAGLATAIGARSFAEVVARTVVAISPGDSDALVADVVNTDDEGTERAEVIVVLGWRPRSWRRRPAFAQLERVPTGSTARSATGPRCASTAWPPCSPPRPGSRWPRGCC